MVFQIEKGRTNSMISTARRGIKELETSEIENLNANADLIDTAIDRWGTAEWNGNVLQVTSEVPSQEFYTGMWYRFFYRPQMPTAQQ
jgi:hypothetical protein